MKQALFIILCLCAGCGESPNEYNIRKYEELLGKKDELCAVQKETIRLEDHSELLKIKNSYMLDLNNEFKKGEVRFYICLRKGKGDSAAMYLGGMNAIAELMKKLKK